jgi:hypothetical protein
MALPTIKSLTDDQYLNMLNRGSEQSQNRVDAPTTLPLLTDQEYMQSLSRRYKLQIGQDPNAVAQTCNSLRKIIHLVAPVSIDTAGSKVALRGTAPGLTWDKDYAPEETKTLFQRTFVLTLPADHMNDTIEIKLVAYIKGKLCWQLGENVSIDLSKLHHLSVVQLNKVSFEA